MADNLIGNMFGVDPEQLSQQRMLAQRQAAFQYAQLDPFQRANMAMYQAGGDIVNAGAGMLGIKTKEQADAESRFNIMNQVDTSSPDGLMKGAQIALQQGNPRLASELNRAAQVMAAEKSKMQYEAAKTAQAEAMAEKLARPETGKVYTEEVGVPGQPNMVVKVERQPDGSWKQIGAPYQKRTDAAEGKPIPPSAAKNMNELESSLNTSSQITHDTSAWAEKIKSGKLNLNLLDNIGGKLAVKAGVAGDQAVELANFATYIEQLRNDRMLLAKGTQTEGDAIRELNGIVSSISDPKYVATRLNALGKNATEKARVAELQLKQYGKRYNIGDYDPSEFKAKSSPYAEQKPEQKQPANVGSSKYKEGQTATNPKTGQKLIFRGGQWQPM